MRRAFTLQMDKGGTRHAHHCELCNEPRVCGGTDCQSTIVTCDRCLTATDCPNCGEELELLWSSDNLDDNGEPIRTNFTAQCECGQSVGFTDLHDGRGPLRFHPLSTDLQDAYAAGNTIKIAARHVHHRGSACPIQGCAWGGGIP